MPSIPANRYFIFGIIALLGLSGDIYSKHLVFRDLGYPAGAKIVTVKGEHQYFGSLIDRRKGSQTEGLKIEGQSRQYLDGWLSFRLYTSFNRGALWGVGQNMTWVFATLSLIAAVGVLYWLFKMGAAHSLWLTISLAFIFSGTLGNLWDRLGWHGCKEANGETLRAVRDFLLFTFGNYNWPVFNFADIFLVTGAIMLGVHSFFMIDEGDKKEPVTNS